MSNLTRYPNQFHQPSPERQAAPEPQVETESVSEAPAAAMSPPVAPPAEVRSTPAPAPIAIPVGSLAVLGLDRWSYAHGTH